MKQVRTILIAEDDQDEQEIISIAFDKFSEDYHLIFASSGQEALDALLLLSDNKQLPHLVILDINMPGKGGLDTLKEIRHSTEYVGLPVVMYSNSDSDLLIRSCKHAGCTDYVVKPSVFSEVVTSVEKMLKHCA